MVPDTTQLLGMPASADTREVEFLKALYNSQPEAPFLKAYIFGRRYKIQDFCNDMFDCLWEVVTKRYYTEVEGLQMELQTWDFDAVIYDPLEEHPGRTPSLATLCLLAVLLRAIRPLLAVHLSGTHPLLRTSRPATLFRDTLHLETHPLLLVLLPATRPLLAIFLTAIPYLPATLLLPTPLAASLLATSLHIPLCRTTAASTTTTATTTFRIQSWLPTTPLATAPTLQTAAASSAP